MAINVLNSNEWLNSLYNAYLLVQTYGNNLSGMDNSLATKFKADADLYHDRFIWTDVNVLKLRDFDITDTNVLATEQKGEVAQQYIEVNKAKQIGLTVGNWLLKRAWQNAGSYDQFESELSAQIGETRRLYEHLMVQTRLGTMKTTTGKQNLSITLPTDTGTGVTNETTAVTTTYTMKEELARLKGEAIAEYLANLFVDMKDPSSSYNDNGFIKSFDSSDLIVIWNAEFRNSILKCSLPTIFDNAGLKADFEGEVMPAKYFGNVNDVTVTTSGTSNTTIRALEEMDVTDTSSVKHHVRPGDLIPNNVALVSSGSIIVPTYTVDSNVICKICAKDGVKYLSAIETSTEFFNSKNLTKNRYLTFSYAEPAYMKARPYITISKA